MMKKALTVFLFAWALAGNAAPGINDRYKVSGDSSVKPVQAFDDGKRLYVQLRSFDRPPATMGSTGEPVPFELRWPYLITELVPVLMLSDDAGGRAFVEVETAKAEPAAALAPVRQGVRGAEVLPSASPESKISVVEGGFAVDDVRQIKIKVVDVLSEDEAGQIRGLLVAPKLIVTDGSLSGYRFARAVAAVSKRIHGVAPEVKKDGAPAGFVVID